MTNSQSIKLKFCVCIMIVLKLLLSVFRLLLIMIFKCLDRPKFDLIIDILLKNVICVCRAKSVQMD